jgi:ABC-type sugar transport system permease subunit
MKSSRLRQYYTASYVMLSPLFILVIVFGIFPIVFSLLLSVQEWSGMGPMKFVGLRNFSFLLFDDLYFWKTVKVTLFLLVFGSFTQHLFAIPLAIVLNNKLIKGRNAFRTAYFLPFITSSVSIALIFSYFFSTSYGLANFVLELFDVKRMAWLENKKLIPISLAVIVNWRYIGWNTVIYLAGLQSIPEELYEAADIDGASSFRKHLSITLPLLLPIVFFALTLSIIGGMQLFDEPFVILGGYPGMGGTDNAGFTSAFYIMWLLQRVGKLGRGSAVSWLLFIIVFAMTFINRRIINKLEGPQD